MFRRIRDRKHVWDRYDLSDLEQERLEVRKSVEKKTTAKKQAEKKPTAAATVSTEEAAAEMAAETAAAAEAGAESVADDGKKETKPAGRTAKAKTTRAAKTAASEKIVLQIGGRDLVMSELIDRVKAAYAAEGHEIDTIKNIDVYVKPEENMAYYVIDEYASGISLY